MTRWIVGSEESTTGDTGGALPGRGQAQVAHREPAGEWHAIDSTSSRPACGSRRFMETFPDRPWGSGEPTSRCADCLAVVSIDDPDAQ